MKTARSGQREREKSKDCCNKIRVTAMTSSLENEVQRIVASMGNEQDDQEPATPETKQMRLFTSTIFQTQLLFSKRKETQQRILPQLKQLLQSQASHPLLLVMQWVFLYFFLMLSTLAFQLSLIFHPPIATVIIIPKSQTVTLHATLQQGRVLNPITISQSETTPTTGKGHQDAKQAKG